MFRFAWLKMVPFYLAGALAVSGGVYYVVSVPPDVMIAAAKAVRTVPWFMAHHAEMAAKIATCNNDPGSAVFDPECENAMAAKSRADTEAFLASAPK